MRSRPPARPRPPGDTFAWVKRPREMIWRFFFIRGRYEVVEG
jgi:hypothetical protein